MGKYHQVKKLSYEIKNNVNRKINCKYDVHILLKGKIMWTTHICLKALVLVTWAAFYLIGCNNIRHSYKHDHQHAP